MNRVKGAMSLFFVLNERAVAEVTTFLQSDDG